MTGNKQYSTCKTAIFHNICRIVIPFTACSVMMSLSAVFLGVDLRQALIFACYQSLLVFLPGYLLFQIAYREASPRPLDVIFASFAVGYALVILEYFICALLGLSDQHARIIALSVAFILLVARAINWTRVDTVNSWGKTDVPYLILFAVLLIIVYFAYAYYYQLPSEKQSSVYYFRDAMYWIENANALKISFPPQELRYAGMQLYYHYFASVYVAYASMVTGIDTFTLGYTLYILTRSALLFGGVYILAQSVIERPLMRILFIVALLFSTGIESNTQAMYVAQLISLPFGFDIAIGYGAYAFSLLILQLRSAQFQWKSIIGAAIAIFMCTGHKAPVGLIYMVFAGIMCLLWLLKRQYSRAIINGILVILAFSLVMIGCVGMFVTDEDETRVSAGEFDPSANLKYTWLYEWHDQYRFAQAETLKEKAVSIFTWTLALAVMIVSYNPLMFFLALYGSINSIRQKTLDGVDAALLSSMLCGTALGAFNYQYGMSQMYYAQAAFLPGLCFGFRRLRLDKKTVNVLFDLCAVSLLAFQIKYYFIDKGIGSSIVGNFEALISEPESMQNENVDYPIDSLQYSDYEALSWIRDHTPQNSIIVSDREVRYEQRTYMYHGTFCERQMYLEGDCYLYDTNSDEREERRDNVRWIYLNSREALNTAKEYGADYVIQTKWIEPQFLGSGCERVYETDTIIVWKIL